MRPGAWLLLIATTSLTAGSLAQEVPLVYHVEHTGASFPLPVLPAFEDLPIVRPLTDPFAWSDGSGRSTDFSDWSHRRAEIKAEIEHYGIGLKPPRPEDITANYSAGTLTVNITENGETLTLTARVALPAGEGPFPAVIGIGAGTGSLPADIFESRDIARIAFNFSQVMSHTQTRGREPINRLYPELTHIGAYSAWSWGVSRLIDGLELVQEDLPIDLDHLGITGCSFAGKMALFAGAFDRAHRTDDCPGVGRRRCRGLARFGDARQCRNPGEHQQCVVYRRHVSIRKSCSEAPLRPS